MRPKRLARRSRMACEYNQAVSEEHVVKTAEPFPVKKTFLYSLVVSVLLSAILGIIAILSGRFGWVEIRIILTTVTIALASICGLACGAYLGTKTAKALPLSGIVFTLLAAAMIIMGMWIEVGSEGYWKLAASISVFARSLCPSIAALDGSPCRVVSMVARRGSRGNLRRRLSDRRDDLLRDSRNGDVPASRCGGDRRRRDDDSGSDIPQAQRVRIDVNR